MMQTKNLEQFRRIIADKNLIETSGIKKINLKKRKKKKISFTITPRQWL